ncbi:DUF3017 domain-containing protein [Planobispora takensis]|uniref:DUF3017 domain-containing protein n=1 Tax=Planobispora takensis TaxID=1367882 RepID=A0A8J3T2Z1_9ACTN|nr:DUF3017 domain-containing protein [Planobispora takensis]GII03466.1 hypothetical protein Pta02_54740 [Planobispora takensis]
MSTIEERWGPYPLILVGAVLAVAYAALVDPYWGGFALGAVIALGAVVRLAGGGRLAVRKKATDVVTLGVLGLALMAGALVLEYSELMPF